MTSTAWPPIPSWQKNALVSLAQANNLGGVTPRALAVIDQEESGGTGGGINSSGYGGFFGEQAGGVYPAGTASAALLRETTPAGFDTQAQIAASSYARDLASTGGNYVAAEEIYQSGKTGTLTPGAKLFETYGFGGKTANTANLTSWVGELTGPGAVAGGASAVAGGVGSSVTSFVAKITFVGGGIVLCLLGLYRAANPKGKTPKLTELPAAAAEAVAA